MLNTRDVASVLNLSSDSVAKYLENLRQKNFVDKISRGKWVIKDSHLDPLQVAEFVISPKESYISLHSALFYHGMITQVPSRIYSVTIDRSRVLRCNLGVFSYHHCHPDFFVGFKYIKPYLKLATPEKSLVDYFYFSPSKTRQFNRLPEIDLPKNFSWKKAYSYCEIIPSRRTKSLVYKKLREMEKI